MLAVRRRQHTASFCVSDRKIADNPFPVQQINRRSWVTRHKTVNNCFCRRKSPKQEARGGLYARQWATMRRDRAMKNPICSNQKNSVILYGWLSFFFFYFVCGDGVWTSRASLSEYAPRYAHYSLPTLFAPKIQKNIFNYNSGAGSIPQAQSLSQGASVLAEYCQLGATRPNFAQTLQPPQSIIPSGK